jgi:hypothetical protein
VISQVLQRPVLACLLVSLHVCAGVIASVPQTAPAKPAPMAETAIRLTDVTAQSGITFRHVNRSGHYYYVEQVGGGAAFLDYDGDGWLDIFFVQGGALPGRHEPAPDTHSLFRNNGDGTFADVTAKVGLPPTPFGFGVATADYDNDGDPDLWVTTLGGSRLYRNERGQRFTDVSAKAGLAGGGFPTSAAFLDFDRDGWLDVFVARYGDYSIERDAGCSEYSLLVAPQEVARRGTKAICAPVHIEGGDSQLYRNNGDGTFRDVSAASGVAAAKARGLGVAVADYNEDGLPDIFVASDLLPNLLFLNRGDGTFAEEGFIGGVAVGPEGRAYAGMGVDAADYDNDGHIDVVVTNFESETTSLYRGTGKGTFVDDSRRSGLTAATLPFLKWGTRFVDLNLDGRLDLFVVNGHVSERVPSYPVQMEHMQKGRGHAQRAQVFENAGEGRFVEVSLNAGPFFRERRVSRGAAFADYDNDGDTDVLVTNTNDAPVLLRNDTKPASPWARVVLIGASPNRDALGAEVRVAAGGLTQLQVVKSGASYLSDHDRRLLFALPGNAPAVAEVRWPCGARQTVPLKRGAAVFVKESGCKLRR